MIHRDRHFAKLDGEFAVFLVGIRINDLWKIHKWLPVVRALFGMLSELREHPETGFLGGEMWLGRSPVLVQYWRSVEQLYAYAGNPESSHLPNWRTYTRTVGNTGEVGHWHETYVVGPGTYENLYANMPPIGLGKVAGLTPVAAGSNKAVNRLRHGGLRKSAHAPPPP